MLTPTEARESEEESCLQEVGWDYHCQNIPQTTIILIIIIIIIVVRGITAKKYLFLYTFASTKLINLNLTPSAANLDYFLTSQCI